MDTSSKTNSINTKTGWKLRSNYNEQGYIKTNEKLQTYVKGLYAAGDVKGSSPIGALAAAYNGGITATSIVHEWYD